MVSINEIEAYCKKASYKLSNAERRLRKSESPNIYRVWNKKGNAIVGYRWSETPVDECCYSFKVFGTHTADCIVIEEMEKTARILVEETDRNLKLI